MTIEHQHLRRLYVPQTLKGVISLQDNQHHYLRNVLRVEVGDHIRLFHVKQGEFLAEIKEVKKKETLVLIKEQLRQTPVIKQTLTLIAPIIHKDRMQWLIEKATELGMTHFQPITTARSENYKAKEDKIEAWFIEAVEQSERLDIPVLLPTISLERAVKQYKQILAAIERQNALPLLSALEKPKSADSISLMIGPAGGFTDEEMLFLNEHDSVQAISLGETILRVETAAAYMLSVVNAAQMIKNN
jgi:16S rRNA (uracil1498-N3)-methyltransferase